MKKPFINNFEDTSFMIMINFAISFMLFIIIIALYSLK